MSLFAQFTVWSGGQTGVDQGALEAAQALGIPTGGWCPKGRRSEAGPIPERFPLQESGSSKYPPRTKKNIEETQGTLILGWGSLGEQGTGTKLTDSYAHSIDKPCLYVDLRAAYNKAIPAARPFQRDSCRVHEWLTRHSIFLLNVAGPRESTRPGIQKRTMNFLLEVLHETAATSLYHKGH